MPTEPIQAMVARTNNLVEGLRSQGRAERLQALKQIKNSIIGHQGKKRQYIEAGAVPSVIQVLSETTQDSELIIQAAAALGSFACAGHDSVSVILSHGGLNALLALISHNHGMPVIRAALRCVKKLYEKGEPDSALILQPATLDQLCQLISNQTDVDVAAMATAILSHSCTGVYEQGILTGCTGLIPAVVKQLHSTQTAEPALQLLFRLAASNKQAAMQILQEENALDLLQTKLRDVCIKIRLLAACCIANMANSCFTQSLETAIDSGLNDALTSRTSCYAMPDATQKPTIIVDVSPAGTMSRGLASCGVAGASRVGSLPSSNFSIPLQKSVPEVSTAQPQHPGIKQGDQHKAAPSSNQAMDTMSDTMPGNFNMHHQLQRLKAGRYDVLLITLQLLTDGKADDMTASTLATLLEDSDDLQGVAVDGDAVKHLCSLLTLTAPKAMQVAVPVHDTKSTKGWSSHQPTKPINSSVRTLEGCLRALGHLCMARPEARKQLLDAKVLPHIHAALHHTYPGIRAAAALAVTALSRNVKTLRCNVLGDDIAASLCQLLHDDNCRVQVNAAAALCNLVLEFSSVKEAVMQAGVLERLASNTASPVTLLRLYSAWALRNLAHKRDRTTKCAIMQALGWQRMWSLLHDPDISVQEQALCILRNLSMDAPEHITATYEWGGSQLLVALEEKLDPCKDVPTHLRVHALYTIVNSLTGSESTKDSIMTSNLAPLLLHHMKNSDDPEVRLAAVWCIINLTWSSSSPATASEGSPASPHTNPQQRAGQLGVEGRIRKLRALGAHNSLAALLVDPSLDVRERVQTALEQLRALDMSATGPANNPA